MPLNILRSGCRMRMQRQMSEDYEMKLKKLISMLTAAGVSMMSVPFAPELLPGDRADRFCCGAGITGAMYVSGMRRI